jgi:hypothetical protein
MILLLAPLATYKYNSTSMLSALWILSHLTSLLTPADGELTIVTSEIPLRTPSTGEGVRVTVGMKSPRSLVHRRELSILVYRPIQLHTRGKSSLAPPPLPENPLVPDAPGLDPPLNPDGPLNPLVPLGPDGPENPSPDQPDNPLKPDGPLGPENPSPLKPEAPL